MQLFVNQLTNVDFSYLDAECGLIGETWLASAYLDGALDEQGMVCDFGIVKKILRNWLDDELDHRLLVPTLSDRLTLENEGDRIRLTWQSNKGLISMSSPAEAIALIEAESITPNSVAKHSRTVLTPAFPDNLDQLTL
ncbi:MAG: 6-pyruvoyl trahydropterin synthase family protein, partial [Oceanobacter sp.]